jgi:hypothetical protein
MEQTLHSATMGMTAHNDVFDTQLGNGILDCGSFAASIPGPVRRDDVTRVTDNEKIARFTLRQQDGVDA